VRCLTRLTIATLLATAVAMPAAAQTTGEDAGQSPPATPPPAQEDDPDRDINRAQPDFTLVALPTTLRMPRYKSSFRVTHRFGRPLGQGDFSDLLEDLFGLDSGAVIGLEYRFGLFRGAQVGIHRTSSTKTIQFMGQYDLKRQSDTFPIGLDALAAIEGVDNFKDSYSPTLGVLLSREIGDYAALYFEPMWVNNSNPQPEELTDDNDTFLIGLGARLRFRPTVYVVFEASPRVAGFDPGVTLVSFGIEKRSGGHLFQLNFSNGLATTFAQIARGGFEGNDWHIGFNISRKFF
jgi:uncharacterized beta barrel domain-containing protein DUF5777